MIQWADRSVIVVTGIGGSGKSTLVKELLFDFDRVLIHDYKREYNFAERFTDFDRMVDELAERNRFIAAWWGGNTCEHKRAVVEGSKDPADKRCPGWIDHLFHFARAKGNTLVVVEEASAYGMPEDSEYAEGVLRTGRDCGVSTLATVQRPAHAPPDYRGNATDVYAFLNHEPSSIEWCKTFFGHRAGELAQLPAGHYLHWSARRPGEIRSGSVDR